MTNKGTIQADSWFSDEASSVFKRIDKYSLSISDFSTKFEKYVFNAINGLWHNGAQDYSFDIESYLEAMMRQRNFLNNRMVLNIYRI